MLPLSRRPNWRQQLRQTQAISCLKEGRPDQFPLAEVQAIINNALLGGSPSSASPTGNTPSTSLTSPLLRRRAPAPQTRECDDLLAGELAQLHGELGAHEAAIAACLHALTYPRARAQLSVVKLDPDQRDEFFDRRVSVFLSLVIVARNANAEVCSDVEADAARDLLAVVQGRARGFAAVSRLLRAVGEGRCEDLMPMRLVSLVLGRSGFGRGVMQELRKLRRKRKWLEAYKLVEILGTYVGMPRVDELLRDVFGHEEYRMWAPWRPNAQRIQLWQSPYISTNREKLGHILDLEGPDSTGQQRSTLRMSSAGPLVGLGGDLDRLLHSLDTCVGIGPEAVGLFTYLFTGRKNITPGSHTIDQVDAATELPDDGVARTLFEFLRSLDSGCTPNNRMLAFIAALPIIQQSPKLQKTFGWPHDTARRAPLALSAVQQQFCLLLQQGNPAERFAINVHALGRAILTSTWMHDSFQPAYLTRLRQMPSEMDIRARFQARAAARDAATRTAHEDFLITQLGFSRRRGAQSTGQEGSESETATPDEPPPVVVVVPDDPIWYAVLDRDRDDLRRRLRDLRGVERSVTTECVKQAAMEADTFVRELEGILLADSDQMCVNLAAFLGARIAAASSGGGTRVHEVWRTLLLQLMRARPPGLLERCAEQLMAQSWRNWVDNLRRIYGDKHLGAAGGLGFTEEAFAGWTRAKMALGVHGVGRSLSQSTYSTSSTGYTSSSFGSGR